MERLIQSAIALDIQRTFKFYQNNDSKYKAGIVQNYLLYHCPKVLHPLPQSPDLNPIENFWNNLDREIRVTPGYIRKSN